VTVVRSDRFPDFIVIGTMKSGTTSLYEWLAQQPEVFLPSMKEPNYFSRDEVFHRGASWYGRLFAPASRGQLVGEASVSYTSPDRCEIAADRMVALVPRATLICLVREPIERLRSHYRHQVQRGREQRPFEEAILDPDAKYVAQSLYYKCLKPYIDRYPRDQICVVRMEDLSADPPLAWDQVLRHLGLALRPRPPGAYNVTGEKSGFTRVMLWLWESGLHRPLMRLPRPLRRLGRHLLLRDDPQYQHLVEQSSRPVPKELVGLVREDVSRLEDWLERDTPLWDRSKYPGS
jgi:hypothetical protein